MSDKLTHDDTLSLQEVLCLGGDLLLLPEKSPLPYEEARALQMAGILDPAESSIYKSAFDLMGIYHQYEAHRSHHGSEPEWMASMPMSVRTHLRFTYAITEEDPLAILPGFPRTGISYMVKNGGLIEDVAHAFSMFRLDGIKQLGFLNQPHYNHYVELRQSLSDTSRYVHSLDVMAITTLIGHNLGITGTELNNLRTLAFTHDVATPAGGDSVKMVDPAGLDEERNFGRFLEGPAFEALERKYGLDKKLLLSGVVNEGLHGEILDIADKIAYTARDVHATLHHIQSGAEHDQYGMKSILVLLERFPHVCSLWDDVVVQNGHAVFTNPRKLVAFLKVRLLMFRELYFSATARFGEFLMSRLLVKVLFKRGVLTSDALIGMTDHELIRLMDTEFGTGTTIDTCSSEHARCKTFARREEAELFMKQLRDAGNVFSMLDDYRLSIKPGTHFLLRSPDGPRTIAEIDPGSARELHEMATSQPMVHVYYLDADPRLSRDVLARLKSELYENGGGT